MLKGKDELFRRLAQPRINEHLKRATRIGAEVLQNEVRSRAPEDRGNLKRSIEIRFDFQGRKITAIVRTDKPYAPWVERGTGIYGPHKTPIVPVHATHMVFYWKKAGRVVRFRSVKGQRGRYFFTRGFKEAAPQVLSIYRQVLSKL